MASTRTPKVTAGTRVTARRSRFGTNFSLSPPVAHRRGSARRSVSARRSPATLLAAVRRRTINEAGELRRSADLAAV